MKSRTVKKMIAGITAAVLISIGGISVSAVEDTKDVAEVVAAGTTVDGTLITYADNVAQEDIDETVKAYLEMPNALKAKMVSDQVRILLYTDTTGPASEYTQAASSYTSPVYYVNLQKEKIRKNNALIRISAGKYEKDALLHSVGHYIDDLCSPNANRLQASSVDEFMPFYEMYGETLRSYDEYAAVVISNEHEMFAECVRLFLKDPQALQAVSADLFVYTANAINTAISIPTK